MNNGQLEPDQMNEAQRAAWQASWTADEQMVAQEFFKSYGEKRVEAVQDLMWALLNSKDFLLVH